MGTGRKTVPDSNGRIFGFVISLFLVVLLAGCAVRQPDLQLVCKEPLEEIDRLQRDLVTSRAQIVAQRAQIEQLQARQKDQGQVLKETVSEAARAEVKLRRFATEADVASRLSEVELAMSEFRAKGESLPLEHTAQALLDAASDAFSVGQLNTAAERAAQSEQIIHMLIRQDSEAAASFIIPIPLRTRVNARLRGSPNREGEPLAVLPEGAPVTAFGYHGLWMHVTTGQDRKGWVSGDLLEVR